MNWVKRFQTEQKNEYTFLREHLFNPEFKIDKRIQHLFIAFFPNLMHIFYYPFFLIILSKIKQPHLRTFGEEIDALLKKESDRNMIMVCLHKTGQIIDAAGDQQLADKFLKLGEIINQDLLLENEKAIFNFQKVYQMIESKYTDRQLKLNAHDLQFQIEAIKSFFPISKYLDTQYIMQKLKVEGEVEAKQTLRPKQTQLKCTYFCRFDQKFESKKQKTYSFYNFLETYNKESFRENFQLVNDQFLVYFSHSRKESEDKMMRKNIECRQNQIWLYFSTKLCEIGEIQRINFKFYQFLKTFGQYDEFYQQLLLLRQKDNPDLISKTELNSQLKLLLKIELLSSEQIKQIHEKLFKQYYKKKKYEKIRELFEEEYKRLMNKNTQLIIIDDLNMFTDESILILIKTSMKTNYFLGNLVEQNIQRLLSDNHLRHQIIIQHIQQLEQKGTYEQMISQLKDYCQSSEIKQLNAVKKEKVYYNFGEIISKHLKCTENQQMYLYFLT